MSRFEGRHQGAVPPPRQEAIPSGRGRVPRSEQLGRSTSTGDTFADDACGSRHMARSMRPLIVPELALGWKSTAAAGAQVLALPDYNPRDPADRRTPVPSASFGCRGDGTRSRDCGSYASVVPRGSEPAWSWCLLAGLVPPAAPLGNPGIRVLLDRRIQRRRAPPWKRREPCEPRRIASTISIREAAHAGRVQATDAQAACPARRTGSRGIPAGSSTRRLLRVS